MKREELHRYEVGKKPIDDIDRVTKLLDYLKNGKDILIEGFEEGDYYYLPAGVMVKTREVYIKELEKTLKMLEQRFEKL